MRLYNTTSSVPARQTLTHQWLCAHNVDLTPRAVVAAARARLRSLPPPCRRRAFGCQSEDMNHLQSLEGAERRIASIVAWRAVRDEIKAAFESVRAACASAFGIIVA